MKRTITMLLGLILALSATFALADASVLRNEEQFSIHFTNTTMTETHAMTLRQGDYLQIQAFLIAGFANVTVKHNNGNILYSGIGDDIPGFSLEIPSTEIYRISVAAQNAVGSIRISTAQAREPMDTGEPPFRYERIVSPLGYLIEFDPDFFIYGQSDANVGDIFVGASKTASADLTVKIVRKAVSFDTAVADTLAIGGFVELDPSVINFRAARTLRRQQGDSPDSAIDQYSLIEMDENEVFYVLASYTVADIETAEPKITRMIEALQFTR